MNLIEKHILKHFPDCKSNDNELFNQIFEEIQSEEKDSHRLLLRYIHFLLDELFIYKQTNTNVLHLHFQYDFDDNSLLIVAQYILIRFFKDSLQSAITTAQANEKLLSFKNKIASEKRKLSTCPDSASGRNGGNKIYKNWITKKQHWKTLSKFYEQVDDKIDITSNAVFNCLIRISNYLEKYIESRPYAVNIENKKYPTFIQLNTNLTLNQIDELDPSIIDNLKTVVLFDCERKKLMHHFSLKDINDDEYISLNNYLILSFEKNDNSVQSLRNKLKLIKDRFKIPDSSSYTILKSEVEHTIKDKIDENIYVSFLGEDKCTFWDEFILETNIQDLYELRSIKMMNIYSLCFSEEIRNFIIQEIFSNNNSSSLISDETKLKLLELRDEDVLTLKNSLNNVLDVILSSEIKQSVIDSKEDKTIIIIDAFVFNSKGFKKLVCSSINVKEGMLIPWSEFKSLENRNSLILSYQDQGRFPYFFCPNLVETTADIGATTKAILHKFIFFNRYQWAKYNLAKDIQKLTTHPLRKKHFNWDKLEDEFKSLRPQMSDDINWDLEQQYSGNANRDTVKLKLKENRERIFNSSELFIYSNDKSNLRVEKIGDIVESMDEDNNCLLQYLDEIQEAINLYEKMIDTSKQETELNIIRQEFQIPTGEDGRIWKILLKKKASETSEDNLYSELKTYLEEKNLKIVSLHHFKNNWLDPESDSIAPLSKKVFLALCDFLNLGKAYFILLQRLRNASKQSSRQSTRQMNRLLQDLFNHGCFDNEVKVSGIIASNLNHYKRNHSLDDIGIDEDHLAENLETLVELIKPEIKLKELQKISKTE